MRIIRLFMVVALGLIGLAAVSYAEEVRTGEVMAVEKSSVTIEDFDTGKSVKLRMDDKTKIKGTLRKGALIELKEKKGRVLSINVIVEEEESEEEAEDETEEKPEGKTDEKTEASE